MGSMDQGFLIDVMKSQGIGVAALVFMVWYFIRRDAGREKETSAREANMTERIQTTEDYIRNRLGDVVEDNTKALVINTEALAKNAEAVKRLEGAIKQDAESKRE